MRSNHFNSLEPSYKKEPAHLYEHKLIICGVDEAGRGSVLGPMVICGICYEAANLDYLRQIGVKDSKQLTRKKRQNFKQLLNDSCCSHEISIVTSKEIDGREEINISLNKLEEIKIASILNKLRPDIIYIDAADVNEKRFGESISALLDYHPKELISRHKADDTFPIVSAASIMAKEKRDELIDSLKEKNGMIGSGYPSDTKTIEFLRGYIKKYKKVPDFARKSWNTTKRLLNEELFNQKITDFLK